MRGFECRFGIRAVCGLPEVLVLQHGARVTYRAVDRNGNTSGAYLVVGPRRTCGADQGMPRGSGQGYEHRPNEGLGSVR